MQVTVHQDRVFALLDVLMARWTAEPKAYPYNRKDSIIPQNIIPPELRKDTFTLSCFYFYICIYMRGGIESLQAFNALIRMWRAHPQLFDPFYVQWVTPSRMQEVLKEFIGWDSKAASINWVENSRRLVEHWKGNPLNLVKGVRTYDEALRRIKNKLGKRERREAGKDGGGFRGFQPKMVSMLLYFFDWEGWLKPRFLYPSPADFHNFRLGLAHEALVVTMPEGGILRATEALSEPWRAVVMEYMKKRKADPVKVSDTLWLYSLVMCGSSPLTRTAEIKSVPLLLGEENWDHSKWAGSVRAEKLEETCLICPIQGTCRFLVPAQPYYRRGQLVLIEKPKLDIEIKQHMIREPSAVLPDATVQADLFKAT